MRVVPVPVLNDNYAYLVIDRQGDAVTIDPAEPEKVLNAARHQRARLHTILTTHRHRDHAGGNHRIAEHLPKVEIVGGAKDKVPACTRTVVDGEELRVGDLVITVLETPYHTPGHLCYLIQEEGCEGTSALFSGDALFIGGCGRRFQGTTKQMYHSLVRVLSTLPPDTLVYCGHEYTCANLEFAAIVDGGNPAVAAKLEWARKQREANLATVPSTIGEELQYNPYLRCHHPAIQRHCGTYPASAAAATATATGSEVAGGQQASGVGGSAREAGREPEPGSASPHDAAPRCSSGGGAAGGAASDKSKPSVAEEEIVMRTLAELRRRKDNHGFAAKMLSTVVTVGAWFGWAP